MALGSPIREQGMGQSTNTQLTTANYARTYNFGQSREHQHQLNDRTTCCGGEDHILGKVHDSNVGEHVRILQLDSLN